MPHDTLPGTADAAPLVCLHSSASSGRQWQAVAAALGAQRAVQAPDLLGYGSSAPWQAGAPVSLDDEAERLLPLLDAQPVHLLGHSYGGAVALQLALRRPERVASLTLYEPVRFAVLFHRPGDAAAVDEIVRVGREVGATVAAGRPEAAAARFVDYWSGAGSWAALPAQRRQAVVERIAKVPADFEALFGDAVPPSAYAGLGMPVQLLGGTRSPRPAHQVLRRLARLLPRAHTMVLDGLGHMGPVEAPQQLLDALALLPSARGPRPAARGKMADDHSAS